MSVRFEMQSSDATTLRADVREDAAESFAFFVQRVLGRRDLSAERLVKLESGAVLPANGEAKLLERWKQLRCTLQGCGACSAALQPTLGWLLPPISGESLHGAA